MARVWTKGLGMAAMVGLLGCAGVGGQEEWGDHRPVVSPDGSTLAFMSDRTGTWVVYTMPLDGSASPERVSDDPRGEWYPDWAPDGTEITYYRQDGEAAFLRSFNVRTGRERALGPTDGYRAGPRWTPDGSRILYRCGETGVCAMTPEGGDLGVAYGLGSGQHGAALSPDGQRVLFVERTEEAGEEAFVMGIDGSERRRLTNDSGRTYGLDWSPDGRYVSYNTEVDGNADIYVLELATGERRRLTSHPAYDHLPRWAPGGEYLVFSSDREGGERVFRIDPDGSNLARIDTGGPPQS